MMALLAPHRTLFLSTLLLFLGIGVSAQNGKNGDIPSDAELESYVEIDLELRKLRQERQKKVMNTIEDSELGVKGFREVSAKVGNKDAEVSDEKKEAYGSTKEKVREIQKEYRKKMRKKIRDMNMKPKRFREIDQMKRNKKVRKKIIRIREKKMEEAQEKNGN
jgi:hypothetical protein